MGLFDKLFSTKDAPDRPAAESQPVAEPQQVDLYTALTMHFRGEVDQALSAYLAIAADLPDLNLAPFLAATAVADLGNTAEAAERLRFLSQRIADSGTTISRAIAQELFNLFNDEPTLKGLAVAELIVTCGDRLRTEGFLRESAVCFEIAAGLLPEHAPVLHKFGDLLHDLGYFDYAQSVLQAALKHAPNHWGALYTYAVLLQDLGRYGEAIPFYEQALRQDPDHAKCRNNYGAALMMTNRLEEALEHCRLAAELDPDLPSIRANLGNINLLLREYETARQHFHDTIALDANFAMAYFGLGSVEQATGDNSGLTEELFRKAVDIAPVAPLFRHALGNFLAGQGNPEALEHFATAAGLHNTMANLHTDFAIACLKLDQQKEALEHLDIAVQQNPDDLRARDILAKLKEGTFSVKKGQK